MKKQTKTTANLDEWFVEITPQLQKKVKRTKEEQKLIDKSKRLWKTYGLSLSAWNRILEDQNNVCKMCKTLPKNGRLSVDHLHIKGFKKLAPLQKSKYVRGALCFLCNTSFGRIERRKNPRELLNSIVKYFDEYPLKGELE